MRPKSSARGVNTAYFWQHRGLVAWLLWPVSRLYGALVALRKWLYKQGVLTTQRVDRPVVVVGNVIAGGAGKTPVVMALVRHLRETGWHPGVISRGYGRSTSDCRSVSADSPAHEVGDEPALIARTFGAQTPLPVFVAGRRIEAAKALLLAYRETDILVCDDGLQHLALHRDLEICIFNDQGVGNGWLLPAGPLREPWPRPVDLVLFAGRRPANVPAASFGLERRLAPCAVRSDGTTVPLADLTGQALYAVAAVARPAEFFAMLQAHGLSLASTEALPDHFDFDSWKPFLDKRQKLICTEKDAIKLWAQYPEALAVPLQVHLPPAFFAAVDAGIRPWAPDQRGPTAAQ